MTTNYDIERLFKTHYAEMHRLAFMIVGDADIARDIVHDVFAACLTHPEIHTSGHYLLKAVRNRCLNYLRHLSAKERMVRLYMLDEKETDDEAWPDDETIAKIRSTVDMDLTPACRRVVYMRFTEEKSYKEIASALGISEVAVYKHLRRAIDVLRQKLS